MSSLAPADSQILLALSQDEAYGYSLLQKLEADSGGRIQPDLGTLYRALARLERDGLVTDAGERPSERGKPRRYYRITERGRRVLERELGRLAEMLELASERGLAAGDTR